MVEDEKFRSPELFESLQKFGIFIPKTEKNGITYHLNDLTLISHRLPSQTIIYIFADLPKKLGGEKNPEADLAKQSSYVLLQRLQKGYEDGTKYQGRIADFGSGTDIQHIALLKLYPQIQTAYGLEVQPHSMNVNRLNALLNEVQDRVVKVDNQNPQNLVSLLGENKLDFAVSNPPYITVPAAFKDRDSVFGYGGDFGLDVTTIFISQVVPLLKDQGEFLFYSILTKDDHGHFFLNDVLEKRGANTSPLNWPVEVTYENLDLAQLEWTRAGYAQALASYMHEYYPTNSCRSNNELEEDAKTLEGLLQQSGVASFSPRIVRLVKRARENSLVIQPEINVSIPLLTERWSLENMPRTSSRVLVESGGEMIQFLVFPKLSPIRKVRLPKLKLPDSPGGEMIRSK